MSFAQDMTNTISAALSAPPPSAPVVESPAPASAESAPAAASPEPVAPSAPAPAPAGPVATPGAPETPAVAAEVAAEPEAEEEFRFPDEKEAPKQEAQSAGDDDDPFEGKPPSDAERAAVTKWLKSPKGKMSLQGFKVLRELQQPPSVDGKGGLGFIPDAQQTKEAFRHSSHLRQMAQDFSGNPQRWVAQWFLPQPGQPVSPGAQAAAQNFLPTLFEQANSGNAAASDLYRAAAAPPVANYINELYQYAQSMPDKQDRILWLNISRFVEDHFTGGKPREIPPELIETGRDPNAPTPEIQELQQLRQYVTTAQQQQAQQREQQITQAITAAIEKPLMGDIDAALAPIKEQFSERAYSAISKAFHAEVVRLTKANPANLRAYAQARETAQANPTRENFEKAGKAWADAARSNIRNLRVQYINDALKPKVAESADRHRTLAEASQKRDAPSVAAPVGKDLAAGPLTPQKLPDGTMETLKEARDRAIRAAISQVA